MNKFEFIMTTAAICVFIQTNNYRPFVPKSDAFAYRLGIATIPTIVVFVLTLMISFVAKKLFIYLATKEDALLIEKNFNILRFCVPISLLVFCFEMLIKEYLPPVVSLIPYIIATIMVHIQKILAKKQ